MTERPPRDAVDPLRDPLHAAAALFTQGNLAEAERICRDAIHSQPLAAKPWSILTAIAVQRKDFVGAIAAGSRALQLQPNSPEVHYNRGLAFHHLDRFAEASDCFSRALQQVPHFVEARLGLGNSLAAQSRLSEAETCYQELLALQPSRATAHNNLGDVLMRQGNHSAAIECFRRAIALSPDLAEAHSNLGVTLQNLEQYHESLPVLRRALEIDPRHATFHYNLALSLERTADDPAAVHHYQQAIQLAPSFTDPYLNLARLHQHQGRSDEALAICQSALEHGPPNEPIWCLLAELQVLRGCLHEAIACYSRALNHFPDSVLLQLALGNACRAAGQMHAAADAYRRALAVDPACFEAHNNLGLVFQSQGDPDAALQCFQAALAIQPQSAEAQSNLAGCQKDRGDLDAAILSYRRSLDLRPDLSATHSNLLYALLYSPASTPQSLLDEHRKWNTAHAAPLAASIRPHPNDRTPKRRLRIGYVSPHFRLHAESFFSVPCFAAHDHEQFEIYCYSDVVNPDDVTQRLRASADVWRETHGLSHESLAALVRSDQIDILVDLTMHMGDNRLLVFARKPAPVQVCWLAYPGTTGLQAIDYRLTDPYLDPPGARDPSYDQSYSEESLRLPDTFWCYDPLTATPPVGPLPAKTNAAITFGSFNNFCKVNDGVIELWSRVLHAVPRSRLLLLAPQGAHRRRLLERFEAHGLAANRIELVAPRPRHQYLELYHQVDIGLDTFPYNGHTTSLDAYWMGVPVVTLVGNTVVGRAGASQLSNLGLVELIAQTPDQFVSITAQLAANSPRLSDLRHTLRPRLQASPLMNAPRFTQNLETTYRQIWQRWCQTDQ